MKIIKKISFILALCIMLIQMPLNTYAFSPVLADDAFDLMELLDIISASEIDDFSADTAVTRGQFCVYLSNALLIEPTNASYKDVFSDVDNDSAWGNYIFSLYQLGVVCGSNGYFEPDRPITYNEAIKMVVSAIGYENAAAISGGYPNGYLKTAADLGVTNSLQIKNYNALSKQEVACLLYLMLNSPILEIKGFEKGIPVYEKSKNETILNTYYDIYKGAGQVVANSSVSLNSSKNYQDGIVLIGDEEYYEGNTNVSELIGFDIEFFYKYDKQSDMKTILMLTNQFGNENIVEINSKDLISYNNYVYKYETESNKTKSARINKNFKVIYNNKYPEYGFTTDMMIPNHGKVKLIPSKNDSDYSVVIIEDYDVDVVAAVDTINQVIYTKKGTEINLKVLDDVVYKLGERIVEIDSINEWNVISVAYSSDKKEATVYISDKYVCGKISEIDTDENYTLKISGMKYNVIDNCYGFDKVDTANTGTFYLDKDGYIAAYTVDNIENNDEYMYAYILSTKSTERNYDEVRTIIKVFDQSGEIKKYTLSNKPKCNGERIKDQTGLNIELDALSEKVIAYKLNNADEICELITYSDDQTDDFIHLVFNGKGHYNTRQQTFAGKVTVKSNAVVFVPHSFDEARYVVRNIGSFENDKEVTVKAYNLKDDIAASIIVTDSSAESYVRNSAIVIKNLKCYDEKYEEVRNKLTVLYQGNETSYFVEENVDVIDELETGDVIQIGFSAKNEIKSIRRIYNSANDLFLQSNPFEPQTGAGFRSQSRMYLGYAYLKKDGVLKYGKEVPTRSNQNSSDLENAKLSEFIIYVIDNTEGEINCYVGNSSDIIDYKAAGNHCSKIIISTNWFDPAEIYIIKN